MNIEFKYGMGFGGTTYYMIITEPGEPIKMSDTGPSHVITEEQAKMRFIHILRTDFGIIMTPEEITFKWNGRI